MLCDQVSCLPTSPKWKETLEAGRGGKAGKIWIQAAWLGVRPGHSNVFRMTKKGHGNRMGPPALSEITEREQDRAPSSPVHYGRGVWTTAAWPEYGGDTQSPVWVKPLFTCWIPPWDIVPHCYRQGVPAAGRVILEEKEKLYLPGWAVLPASQNTWLRQPTSHSFSAVFPNNF